MASDKSKKQPVNQQQEPQQEAAAKPPEPKAGVLTGICKFTYGEVHRTEIKNAPYNPRTMTTEARAKLKKSLMKNGLVEPLVWNKRTGNIVGGHQRIGLLDSIEGTNQYLVPCAIIDVSDAQEKTINVALNNRHAQGDFLHEDLQKLLSEPGVDYESAGYDATDIYHLFGKEVANAITKMFDDKEEREKEGSDKPESSQGDGSTALDDKMRGMLDRHESIVRSFDDANGYEFYWMAIFRGDVERAAFARLLGIDEAKRHVDGKTLISLLGMDEKYETILQQVRKEWDDWANGISTKQDAKKPSGTEDAKIQ